MAIEFIIMPKESAVETAELILEIFTKYEPMTICNNVDKDKMLVLLNYLTQFGAEAELIVIARDIETNKIIGCITNKDFMLSPSPNLPEKYYSYISMFEADIAMCTELEEPLKNKNLVIGELFQSFHLCVLPEYKGRGIATKLVSEAITLAKRLGYRAIMAECSVEPSRRAFEKNGFKRINKLSYKKFQFNGKAFYGALEGDLSLMYMDLI